MLVDQVISVLDALQVLVEPLLTPLMHLALQLQISDVLGTLLPGQGGTLFLLLLHLLLDLLKLHAPVLLLDHLLVRRSLLIHLTIVLQRVKCLNFGLILHDISLLLHRIRMCLIFQSQLPTS